MRDLFFFIWWLEGGFLFAVDRRTLVAEASKGCSVISQVAEWLFNRVVEGVRTLYSTTYSVPQAA